MAISNQGDNVIHAMTRQGRKIGMTFQLANVTKPLGPVMLEARSNVVFEKGNSYVKAYSGRVKKPIEERSGGIPI